MNKFSERLLAAGMRVFDRLLFVVISLCLFALGLSMFARLFSEDLVFLLVAWVAAFIGVVTVVGLLLFLAVLAWYVNYR